MISERSEYKSQPVLILKRNENDKYPFTFGLSKARLILEAIEEIKKFAVELSDPTSKPNQPENTGTAEDAAIVLTSRFCNHCGTKLIITTERCPKCGQEL